MDQLPTRTIEKINAEEPAIDIDELRREIDTLDAAILAAVARRTEISQQIECARVKDGGPKLEHSRERKVLGTYIEGLGDDGRDLGMIILKHSRGRLGR